MPSAGVQTGTPAAGPFIMADNYKARKQFTVRQAGNISQMGPEMSSGDEIGGHGREVCDHNG